MAFIPVVNGGALPVFASDYLYGYSNAATANEYYPQTFPGNVTNTPVPATNLAGPKYDYFKVIFNKAAAGAQTHGGDISRLAGAGEAASLLLQTIQLRGTVAIYSIKETTADTSSVVSVAVYPTGAFNTATDGDDNSSVTLTALINGLGVVTAQDGTQFDFTTATGGLAVTQPGFVLV